MFGLLEPWGWWQERQSPPEPVTCWNTNGPRRSAWQERQGSSPWTVILTGSPPRACGSWQSRHVMPPRSSRCAYGLFWNDAVSGRWQVAQSLPGSFARRWVLLGVGLWIEWHDRQFTAAVFAWKS